IVDRLFGAVGGRQRPSQTLSVGTGRDVQGGVGVVCGGDDQLLTVLLREVVSGFYRLVEVAGLTDLPARVRLMILLVDARALDLEEEALVIVEQIDGLVRQRVEARNLRSALGVVLALHGR